jgi:hypothetical protein
VAHRAAVQTGLAPDTEPGPHGDAAARERQARDRRFMPPSAAQAIHDSPMPGTEPPPTPGRLADVPAVETVAGSGVRGAETGGAFTAEAVREPAISGFEDPAPAARAAVARPAVASDRQGLFAGEYRERERDLPPAGRASDRQDRSLQAVFSRLSGAGGERLPDPRDRARTTPGLGPVFGRLR